MSVPVSFQHGMVIRQSALRARGISRDAVLAALETDAPLAESPDLLSFSPMFGEEAGEEFVRRLKAPGLVYFDDFFDLTLDHPEWLSFCIRQA